MVVYNNNNSKVAKYLKKKHLLLDKNLDADKDNKPISKLPKRSLLKLF